MEQEELLRHLLATIAYRFSKSIKNADTSFFDLKSINGIRTPVEIINHINQVNCFTVSILKNSEVEKIIQLDARKEIDRFYFLLENIDGAIQKGTVESSIIMELIQGPLSDILTHIGQISLLRRYFNDPIKGEDFTIAEIKIGTLRY